MLHEKRNNKTTNSNKHSCVLSIYSTTCLNQTSLVPTVVFGIDRFLVYRQRFPTFGLYLKFDLHRIPFILVSLYTGFTV